jgi:hypothetical protein
MLFRRLFRYSLGLLFLAFLLLVPIFAQVPVDKTKVPLPWYAQPKIPVLSKPGPSKPEIESLRVLVARLLKYTADAGCHKNDCKILIADLGQLADELSREKSARRTLRAEVKARSARILEQLNSIAAGDGRRK